MAAVNAIVLPAYSLLRQAVSRDDVDVVNSSIFFPAVQTNAAMTDVEFGRSEQRQVCSMMALPTRTAVLSGPRSRSPEWIDFLAGLYHHFLREHQVFSRLFRVCR